MSRINNVKDVYEHRSVLKRIKSSDTIIAHIARLFLKAIRERRRFRTLDCLKVLRSLVKGLPVDTALQAGTISALFEIYKHFIFSGKDEVEWCVSAMIKDKQLGDEAVDWLLSNRDRSKHIVNRLLLYPCSHSKIRQWAEQAFCEGALSDRRYELLALLVEEGIPDNARNENSATILWAVFKARIPRERKVDLLKRYSDLDSLTSAVEIAARLEAPEILRSLLDKLEDASNS